MKNKLCLVPLLLALATSTLMATDEDDQVHQAAGIMNRFRSMPEGQIPHRVLRDAKGLAILKVVKGGFIWSAKYGDGVVVTHTSHGWSGPSFIRTTGVGVGPQIGGQVTDLVLVLNTDEAVRAFANGANVELGGALSIAAGPVGRAAEAGINEKAAVFAYSLNKGLFAGVSLEGTVITPREEANARFYREPVTPARILSGKVSAPHRSAELTSSL